MTGHVCAICGLDSLFFYWSSTRNFPRKGLVKLLDTPNETKTGIVKGLKSYPVCYKCSAKLGYGKL